MVPGGNAVCEHGNVTLFERIHERDFLEIYYIYNSISRKTYFHVISQIVIN
jgi:hypothetical protein